MKGVRKTSNLNSNKSSSKKRTETRKNLMKKTSPKNLRKNNIRNFENKEIEEIIINKGKIDSTIAISMIILVILGSIMVFSASYYFAETKIGDITHFFKKQAIFAGIGFLLVFFVISKVDWRVFKKFSWFLYILFCFFSFLVLFIGIEAKGAKRWLGVGPFQFQPSELTKVGLILFLSRYLDENKNILNTWGGFLKACFWVGIPFVLIGVENASTAIILGVIGMSIIFVASPRIDYFIAMAGAGVAGLVGMFTFGAKFRMARLEAWLNPFAEGVSSDVGFQTVQSLYAIGSGGFFGLGLGQSRQKLGFIPEGHNDIIFSVICEELGIFGAFVFIALFAMIIWRGYIIAIKAPKTYMTYVCTGITTMIAVQVVLNIAVVTNTIPNTGIPLPFVSYGGTSLIILMASTGILLNFSRYFTND